MRLTPRIALLSILPLVAAAPSLSSAADQPGYSPDAAMMQQLLEAQRLARQAGDDMLRALDAAERALPRYGMPYLDGEGNIVIPRLPSPRGTPVPEAGPGPL